MSKWARIENNEVRETVDFDPAGRYTSDLVWVECDQNVACYWTYNAKTKKFSPPVETETIPSPELPPERIGEALETDEEATPTA